MHPFNSYHTCWNLCWPSITKSASDCSLHFIITLTELRHDEVRQIGHCRVVEHDLREIEGFLCFILKRKKTNLRANALKSRFFNSHFFGDAIWFNHILWSIFHFELLKATVSILECNCIQNQLKINQDTVDAKCKPSKEACKRPLRLLRAELGMFIVERSQEPVGMDNIIHQYSIEAWKSVCFNWCWYFLHQQHHVMGVHMKHKWMGAPQPCD